MRNCREIVGQLETGRGKLVFPVVWQRLEKESRETEKWGKDKVNYFKISRILDIEKTVYIAYWYTRS